VKCFARRNNDKLIITITGDFHGDSLADYCTVFHEHNLAELSEITIDLKKADYISLKGVGLITATMIEARQQGANCQLVNVQPKIAGAIAITGHTENDLHKDADETAVLFYK
jgi:anti-anti-sigma factor